MFMLCLTFSRLLLCWNAWGLGIRTCLKKKKSHFVVFARFRLEKKSRDRLSELIEIMFMIFSGSLNRAWELETKCRLEDLD
jgi:hypothetical protein